MTEKNKAILKKIFADSEKSLQKYSDFYDECLEELAETRDPDSCRGLVSRQVLLVIHATAKALGALEEEGSTER